MESCAVHHALSQNFFWCKKSCRLSSRSHDLDSRHRFSDASLQRDEWKEVETKRQWGLLPVNSHGSTTAGPAPTCGLLIVCTKSCSTSFFRTPGRLHFGVNYDQCVRENVEFLCGWKEIANYLEIGPTWRKIPLVLKKSPSWCLRAD